MTITDADRHRLYDALVATLGEQEAAILMEHLPPVGWADVATKTDLEHLRAEMNSGFRAAQAAMDTRTETLRAEMAVGFARSDTQIATLQASMEAKFNSQLRWIIGTIIASYAVMVAIAGLGR